MKYIKRSAVVTAAVALAFAAVPAEGATSAGSVAVVGQIGIGSGLSSSAGLTVGGTCGAATVAAQPAAGAGTCTLATSGRASGSCATWQGSVSGSLHSSAGVGGATSYGLRLSLTVIGGSVVVVQGTATANGEVKSVTGGGVAYPITGSCDGPAVYGWSGSLTIGG